MARAIWSVAGSVPTMTDLLNLDHSELVELVESLGQPAYRSRQIWRQIYQRGVTDPRQMSDLPEEMRRRLSEQVEDSRTPLEVQTSADGSTSKALLQLVDDELIETVLDSIGTSRHGVPVLAGRLRHGLRLLRHGTSRPQATTHGR